MSGFYTVPFNSTMTSAGDLCEISASSSQPLIILEVKVYQVGVTDIGDAQEELLEIVIETGNTIAGTGGTAVTPANTAVGGTASGFVARSGSTVPASGGTATERFRDGWNVRIPYPAVFTEARQYILPALTRAVLRLRSVPADSLTIRGEMLIQEIG